LREGKYVALAMHINEILLEDEIIGRNLASETILQLARILSQERFFAMRYDRHLKHFYGEIESVLESDAACNMPVPAFTWFKIYEILQATRHYSWSQEYRFWRRLFGSRLNLDFVANDIREDIIIYRYRRMQFPIIPSCYYTPGIRLKYEYGNPIDLRRQMTFVSSYMVKWFDTVVLHEVDIQGRYGYGIIDFLVLEGIASLFYDGVFEGDNSSYSTFGFRPEVDFRYYIENNIYVELNGGCDFRRERTMSPEIHYDYIASWFIEFRTRWRIF
jgi:hypothetical protein